MSRTYSDPSYGSKKVLRTNGYTAGTRATALVESIKVMNPISVTDWSMTNNTLGTGGSSQWVLAATSGAGTSALGTIIFVGTHALGATVNGSVTATTVQTGGTLDLYSVLSTAAGLTVTADVQYTETYIQSDN